MRSGRPHFVVGMDGSVEPFDEAKAREATDASLCRKGSQQLPLCGQPEQCVSAVDDGAGTSQQVIERVGGSDEIEAW